VRIGTKVDTLGIGRPGQASSMGDPQWVIAAIAVAIVFVLAVSWGRRR
jgi:hypothetical protein